MDEKINCKGRSLQVCCECHTIRYSVVDFDVLTDVYVMMSSGSRICQAGILMLTESEAWREVLLSHLLKDGNHLFCTIFNCG